MVVRVSGERYDAPDGAESASDLAFDAMEAEQDREYEAAGVTDADGVVVDPGVLAVDAGDAGLDDTRPESTSQV